MITDEEAKEYARELVSVDKGYNELNEKLDEYCENHRCFRCPLMIRRCKISDYYSCMFRGKMDIQMDKLEQLLVDYSPQAVLRKLEGDTIREDRGYYRDTEKIRGKLVDYIRAPRDPLDYLIEQEEKQELLALVQKVYAELPQELSEVFFLCVIKGSSNVDVSDFLGVSERTVKRRLDKVYEVLKKHASEVTVDNHESALEAHAPRDFIRYASEFYKDYYEGRVNRQGNYITHCRVERYFDEVFGDDKTCCGMCEKCSNGLMRKRRDK